MSVPNISQNISFLMDKTCGKSPPENSKEFFETILNRFGENTGGTENSVPDFPGTEQMKEISAHLLCGYFRKTLERDSFIAMGQGLEKGRGTAGRQKEYPAQNAGMPESVSETSETGRISAWFESGTSAGKAVGYDAAGGTSYGLYQIASRPGTMERFLNYLEIREPGWAHRLRASGPADTGSRKGDMPRVWKEIASENEARLNRLQYEFIRSTHYTPAENQIARKCGIQIGERTSLLQEALWSTAVQHGPGGAAAIFQSAVNELRNGGSHISDRSLIEQVYEIRKERAGYAADPALKESLLRRYEEEKKRTLAMSAFM
ncbi:MAG: hypothetical protein V2I97_02460 [Desulfococcaceae bacterium]|nr:hypothetical protein [Desulfococcaceae bacterium]